MTGPSSGVKTIAVTIVGLDRDTALDFVKEMRKIDGVSSVESREIGAQRANIEVVHEGPADVLYDKIRELSVAGKKLTATEDIRGARLFLKVK